MNSHTNFGCQISYSALSQIYETLGYYYAHDSFAKILSWDQNRLNQGNSLTIP